MRSVREMMEAWNGARDAVISSGVDGMLLVCGTDMTHIFLSLFLSRHRGCGLLTAYNKVQKLASMQDTSVSLQRRPGSAHSPRPTGPGCREKPRQYV